MASTADALHRAVKTSLGFNEAKEDGVFGMTVASAGPYANDLHLAPDNRTNTSSLNFCRPGALPDAQATVSKHGRQYILSHSVP